MSLKLPRMANLPVPREDQFTSPLRSPAVAARVGTALGVCFTVCFVTGLISHWAQNPNPWFFVPTRPSWGYRVTQGLHVASGTAAIPLLLVKLWAVFPRLFAGFPKPGKGLLLVLTERLSIAVLVASSLFLLATGLLNTAQWYPWAFTFRRTHSAMAWIAIGALLLHIAVKLPVIRAALRAPIDSAELDRPEMSPPTSPVAAGGLSRRGLVRTAWLSSGVAVLASAGATVPALRQISVFGVRSGDGPQGIPINKSAKAARVLASATSPEYRLTVAKGERIVELSLTELLAMPSNRADLPIACVEGWSAQGSWRGVRIRDLVDLVGGTSGSAVRVTSLQVGGHYRVTRLPASYAADPLTLLATHLNGERLSLDHGFPARIIAPNRPGVLQTKWVTRLEVL